MCPRCELIFPRWLVQIPTYSKEHRGTKPFQDVDRQWIRSIHGGFLSHRVTPSHHPFQIGIFPEINQPAMGGSSIYGNPHMYMIYEFHLWRNIETSVCMLNSWFNIGHCRFYLTSKLYPIITSKSPKLVPYHILCTINACTNNTYWFILSVKYIYIWVSSNGGTQQWLLYNGQSHWNGWWLGEPLF